jgi:lipopolysaccharide transport system ATP-binding protein
MTGYVRVESLGKRFDRYAQERAWTLKQAMIQGWRGRRAVDHFWALQDVSFEVKPGEMLGLVGHNGAGKSTLLRLLGGVLRPDTGSVHVEGSLSGLLELNTGMHPDLSGRENLLIGGVVAGLSYREVRAKFDEIVAFAELEEFIDNPIRTYSAGMKLRLGFSVAVHGRPGNLLIDEVLSVGDGAFQAKCLRRIQRFKEEGSAIILSTHDLGQMASMCQRALWLKGGKMISLGQADVVAADYRVDMATRLLADAPPMVEDEVTCQGVVLRAGENRFGTMRHRIVAVRLLDQQGSTIDAIETGSTLAVEVNWHSDANDAPILSVALLEPGKEKIIDVNTVADGTHIVARAGRRRAALTFERLDIAAGSYRLEIGLFASDWSHAHDFHHQTYKLDVTAPRAVAGVLDPPRRWIVE